MSEPGNMADGWVYSFSRWLIIITYRMRSTVHHWARLIHNMLDSFLQGQLASAIITEQHSLCKTACKQNFSWHTNPGMETLNNMVSALECHKIKCVYPLWPAKQANWRLLVLIHLRYSVSCRCYFPQWQHNSGPKWHVGSLLGKLLCTLTVSITGSKFPAESEVFFFTPLSWQTD